MTLRELADLILNTVDDDALDSEVVGIYGEHSVIHGVLRNVHVRLPDGGSVDIHNTVDKVTQ